MQARGKVINHGNGTRLGSRGQNLLDTSPHCSAKEKKDAGKGQQSQMPLMPGPPMSGAAMAPLAPMMNWGMQVPMPYQPMPYQPTTAPRSAVASLPSGEPTQSSIIGPCHWPLPAMPKMPAVPTATVQAVDLDLMTMLKQDVAELLLHIRKAVKESALKEGVKEGARATRALQSAAKKITLRNLQPKKRNFKIK